MPVIIKRYRNRKLYNTQSKRYITLEGIEGLIKQQEDIIVVDNDTGNDITATTLSQIIFGLEKNQTGSLPINLLISLIQSGGKKMDEIRRNILNSVNLVHHYDEEIERRVNLLIANGDFSQEAGTQLLKKLFLGQPQKSVQAKRILAYVRVDVERDFRARRRHFRERRHADRNVIADPVSFHDRLVRMFRQQRPSKMRNHRGYCTAALPAARPRQ